MTPPDRCPICDQAEHLGCPWDASYDMLSKEFDDALVDCKRNAVDWRTRYFAEQSRRRQIIGAVAGGALLLGGSLMLWWGAP